MPNEAHERIRQDLADRKTWEDRQRTWYKMRHGGIPRARKPFPTAADLHWPLIDGNIGKLIPFYFSQVYGSDLLASFVPLTSDVPEDFARQAAWWFDGQLNQESNFFEEILSTIDSHLMTGWTPLKVTMRQKPGKKGRSLCFDAVDPIFFVLPAVAMDLDTVDRACHILQLTPAQYAANSNFNQDKDLVKSLTGKGEETGKQQEKYQREGLTRGQFDDQIVLWETYERTASGITVHTYSPMHPDREVRAPFALPDHYEGLPFDLYQTEFKDKGVYAVRGVPERIAPHEMYLSRLWNEKADAMSFMNRPLFTSNGPLPGNLNNVKISPGEFLPNNVSAVQFGQVPFDFDQEQQNTRMIAEYLLAMPDFGLSAQNDKKDPRSATEINAVSSLMGVSVDLRARIFRRAEGKTYRRSWRLLRAEIETNPFNGMQTVLARGRANQVDPQALAAAYSIDPDGSPDAWNKEQRMQRARERLQLFTGNPFVEQPELTRDVLAEDNPALVDRLYRDPKVKEVEALQAQARAIAEVIMQLKQDGAPDDPVSIQTLGNALTQRVQALQQINPQAAQQVQQELTQAAAQFQQMSQPAPMPVATAA